MHGWSLRKSTGWCSPPRRICCLASTSRSTSLSPGFPNPRGSLRASTRRLGRACDKVLVVSADLGAQTRDHAKLIWTGLDALRERHVPMNGITLFAFMSSVYMSLYGASEDELSLVTVKNRQNGVDNEFAQLRSEITLEDIAASAMIAWPIRAAHVGPPGGGAAAVIVGRAVGNPGARDISVVGLGSCAAAYSIGSRVSRDDPTFGYAPEMTKAAAAAYAMAGIGNPETAVEAAELYTSYPISELIG
jgi:acetyl-CoA acetyltransferase